MSLTVREGQVHALLGENGAGKSTLIKILSGAYARDEGEILFDGKPVDIRGPEDAQELGISTIYQEFNLARDLTVAENIFLGHLPRKGLRVDWETARRSAPARSSTGWGSTIGVDAVGGHAVRGRAAAGGDRQGAEPPARASSSWTSPRRCWPRATWSTSSR